MPFADNRRTGICVYVSFMEPITEHVCKFVVHFRIFKAKLKNIFMSLSKKQKPLCQMLMTGLSERDKEKGNEEPHLVLMS